MKKSSSVAVTAVAAISLSIACSSSERESRVCVDESQRVVSADKCEQAARHVGMPYFWYYHAAYARGVYPTLGAPVHGGGTRVAPVNAPVSRGGFGATANGRTVSA